MTTSTRKKQTRLVAVGEETSAARRRTEPATFPAEVNLFKMLVTNPKTTVLLEVEGDADPDIDVHTGDTLIVDRSIAPRRGDLCVVETDEGLIVNRYEARRGLRLVGTEAPDAAQQVYGAVTFIIRAQRAGREENR